MRAVLCDRFDGIGALRVGEAAEPVPAEDEILFVGGEIPSVPVNLPLLKNYSIVGVFVGAWATRFPDEAATATDKIMALVGEGELRPRVDRVLLLEQAAEAMRAVAERHVQARVVLRVRQSGGSNGG